MHTYTHTYIHTCIQTDGQTDIHTYIHCKSFQVGVSEKDDDKPNGLLALGAIHSRTNPVQVGFDKKLKTSTGSLNVARPPGPPMKILDLDLNEINPTEK